MTVVFRDADDWDYALVRHDYPDDASPPYWMDHHEKVVMANDEEVAIVSWLECQDQIIITQLYVFPPYRNKMIGAYILGILANGEDRMCRVLCTPTTQPYYEKQGFFVDHGHVIVTKVPQEFNETV